MTIFRSSRKVRNKLKFIDSSWEKLEKLLTEETTQSGKNLAGFTSKKPQKYALMFEKESILEHYGCFLRN